MILLYTLLPNSKVKFFLNKEFPNFNTIIPQNAREFETLQQAQQYAKDWKANTGQDKDIYFLEI